MREIDGERRGWRERHSEVVIDENCHFNFACSDNSHFLLTNLLLDDLRRAPAARVINVSAQSHENIKDDFNFDKSFIHSAATTNVPFGI